MGEESPLKGAGNSTSYLMVFYFIFLWPISAPDFILNRFRPDTMQGEYLNEVCSVGCR